MLKTDLLELKKTIKNDGNITVSRIATCYVYGIERKTIRKDMSFLNLPEEEFHKYLDILKKLMSCKAGDTLQSIKFLNDECHKVLDTFRQTELKQPEIIDAFCEQFIKSYETVGNYLIVFFYSAYDVPAKGSDKLRQGESDEVYNAIYCAVCPVELSEPGLSYHEDTMEIHNRVRDWVVANPEIGFMYPDFHNRTVDCGKVAFAMCNKKYPHKELSQALFGSSTVPTADVQAKTFEAALAETLGDEDAQKVTAAARNIIATVKNIEDRVKANDEIIKSDESNDDPNAFVVIKEPVATIADIKEAIVTSGIKEEKAEEFARVYKELSPEVSDCVRIDKTYKKGKIKFENIDISVPSEKMDDVRIEEIEGKRCVVIELTDNYSDISINGIVCGRAEQTPDEEETDED